MKGYPWSTSTEGGKCAACLPLRDAAFLILALPSSPSKQACDPSAALCWRHAGVKGSSGAHKELSREL